MVIDILPEPSPIPVRSRQAFYCDDLTTLPRPELGTILVTGATGYIGGRLVPELLERGYKVRIMVRAGSSDLTSRWPGVEVVVADALDEKSLPPALEGVHTAYYLIHSLLMGQKKFEEFDLKAAGNFRIACEGSNIKRIIYLSGLGNIDTALSPHLQNRNNVAKKLGEGSVPVTVLRAGMIIGSGSASYEILSNLVKNTPIFFIPGWARTQSQPISVRDVIKYLVGCLENGETMGKLYDIGGPDIITYDDKLRILSHLYGRKRIFLPALITSTWLYGYIASLLTPVPGPITKSLVEGCRNEVICQNNEIRELIPFKPLDFKEALVAALKREDKNEVVSRWSDAYPPAFELAEKIHELSSAPKYTSAYCMLTYKPKDAIFRSFCNIGGKMGWFQSNWMWRLRGMVDRIFMGVGSSRGRRSDSNLRINDVIDFFRVENIVTDRLLLLRAEMKLPGKAWLEFNLDSYEGLNKLTVNAYFEPSGVSGIIYWYFFLPFHFYIFKDLIKQIEKRA